MVLCQSVVFEIVQLEEGQNGVSDCKTSRFELVDYLYNFFLRCYPYETVVQVCDDEPRIDAMFLQMQVSNSHSFSSIPVLHDESDARLLYVAFAKWVWVLFALLHCRTVSKNALKSTLFYDEKLRKLRLLSTWTAESAFCAHSLFQNGQIGRMFNAPIAEIRAFLNALRTCTGQSFSSIDLIQQHTVNWTGTRLARMAFTIRIRHICDPELFALNFEMLLQSWEVL